MAADSITAWAAILRENRLLEPAQLNELDRLLVRFPDPRALARELVGRAWLTPYQVNQLFQERGQLLLLGSHVLLERLGEGGMGQVFKARNWKLHRIVAIKLIRKERLTGPDATRRFLREIRAVAQLDHPHIVHAYDADEVGGSLLLVMEYVEGVDLGRLLKEQGPLPVGEACAYVRQAALGLQHAFERELVHRDIKPSNLLLARGPKGADRGTIKILDLGLARLIRLPEEASTTLTEEGSLLGTLDYLAPEQAEDAHGVDIRTDLYSLGCTFYHLLTGQVPFPGGTAPVKLLKHRLGEPVAVEHLRPEVPPEVAAVVRKLMAKRPEDRYQTPAEVAAALTTGPIPGDGPVQVSPPPAVVESPFAETARNPPGETILSPRRFRQPLRPRRRLWAVAAGCFGLFLLLSSLVFLLLSSRGDPKSTSLGDPGPALSGGPGREAPVAAVPPPGPQKEPITVLGESRGNVICGALSADGRVAASGEGDGTIRVWDLTTGQQPQELRHGSRMTSLALSLDGKVLVSFGPGTRRFRHWKLSAAVYEDLGRININYGQILALSPDGKVVAAGMPDYVQFWDLPSNKSQVVLKEPAIVATAGVFAADGHHFAAGSRDGELQLWDLTAGPIREPLVSPGRTGVVLSVAIAPDGKAVAAGGKDGLVRIWDVAGREPKARPTGERHAGGVSAVAFSPDAGLLASAGPDGRVILWAVRSAEKTWERQLPRPITAAAFAPDGKSLTTVNGDGTLSILLLPDPKAARR
jgi:serine/threonine protein kinase